MKSTEINHLWQSITACVADIHRQRVIHLDIKPENFIRVGDTWKLIDFGLSHVLSDDTCDDVHVSMVQGTSGYLPPECYTSELVNDDRGNKQFLTKIR